MIFRAFLLLLFASVAVARSGGTALGAIRLILRDPGAGLPTWRVTVLDGAGVPDGVLVVNAENGTVLSSDGFEKAPPSDLLAAPQSRHDRGESSHGASVRLRKATPTPKPGFLKRLFGKSDKDPKSEQ